MLQIILIGKIDNYIRPGFESLICSKGDDSMISFILGVMTGIIVTLLVCWLYSVIMNKLSPAITLWITLRHVKIKNHQFVIKAREINSRIIQWKYETESGEYIHHTFLFVYLWSSPEKVTKQLNTKIEKTITTLKSKY